jgi:hypothetical protein
VHAQVINGRVIADSTNQPINATITTSSHYQTSCNGIGDFSIKVSGRHDTIRISAIGFKTFLYPVSEWQQQDIIIRLKASSHILKDVTIQSKRNPKTDSINNRKQFSQVFNYQPPKIKDAFSGPPAENVPFAFVSVNLLVLIEALTKKSDPTYKLQQLMIKDEQANYVSSRYSRGLVARITQLKGDSLDQFYNKYFPAIDWVKKTSDYDMILYIKAKLTDFQKAR